MGARVQLRCNGVYSRFISSFFFRDLNSFWLMTFRSDPTTIIHIQTHTHTLVRATNQMFTIFGVFCSIFLFHDHRCSLQYNNTNNNKFISRNWTFYERNPLFKISPVAFELILPFISVVLVRLFKFLIHRKNTNEIGHW